MATFGVLTYFNYYNYGSMLQGYATQSVMQNLIDKDDVCELINYRYSPSGNSFFRLLFPRLLRFWDYVFRYKEILTKKRYASRFKIRMRRFDEFVLDNIKVTSTFYHNKEDLQKNPPKYDVYIIGSDQTWSPIVSGGYKETPMLLDYLDKSTIKCAYAPSLGVTKLSEEDAILLKKHISDFSVVSCREEVGAEILSTLLERDVEAVLDPSLLLSRHDWLSIANLPTLEKGTYIICYFLGDKPYYRNFAIQLSRQTGLPLYYIPVSWRDCSTSNNLLFDVGPKEFIGLIENAAYVLTDSFHGIAFSTNFNKEFYAFIKHQGGNSGGDNSRLFDFLRRLKLTDRLIDRYLGGNIDLNDIDYTYVNKRIKEDRIKSHTVLSQIIALAKSH